MRRLTQWCLVLAALGLGMGSLLWAEQPAITAEARAALRYFLDTDCEVVNGSNPLDQLLKYKVELEPLLLTLLKSGPDPEALAEVQRYLESSWARREAFLRENPQLGLNEDEMKILRETKKEDYLRLGRDRFVEKHREKAAIGLAAIGSPAALRALQEASKEENESLRTVIQSALAKYQKKR